MRILKLFLVTLLCIPSASAWADDQLVDEFMVKSGLQRQVELIPEGMQVAFEQRFQQDQSMSAADRYNLRKSAEQSFQPEVMLKTIKAEIVAGLSDNDIKEILVWLNSPLGMKITQIEEENSSAKAQREMLEYMQTMPEPDPARLAIIERMDQAAQMTQCAVKVKMAMALAMTEAMACASGCKNFDRDALVQQFEKARPQIEEATMQETMLHALFSYRTLNDQELDEYIKFFETPAGQKYMAVTSSALASAVKDSAKTMGEILGASFKQKQE